MGQLATASLPLPAGHCEVASANPLLPSHHRTTPHGQVTAGTICCRQPKEELGGQSAEQRWLPIFISLATFANAVELWAQEARDGGRLWGGGGSQGCPICTPSTATAPCLFRPEFRVVVAGGVKMGSPRPPTCSPGSSSDCPWRVASLSWPCGVVLQRFGGSELAEATWWWADHAKLPCRVVLDPAG